MKFLGLLILVSLVGCSSTIEYRQEMPEFEETEFMSDEEILEELRLNDSGEEMDLPPTVEEIERELNLIPDEDFLKDVPSIPKEFTTDEIPTDAPYSVDLRYRDTPVKSQWNGTCTVFGGVASIENLMNRDGVIEGLDLSEPHGWSHYKQYSSVAFLKAHTNVEKNRIGDEVDYPKYGKAGKNLTPHTMITKHTYVGDSPRAVVEALWKRENPLYLALKTPKQMLSCRDVISGGTHANGGHAVAIVGYKILDGRVLAIIKNSWGDDCGDNGYQYMDLALCRKKGFYCNIWEIEEVDTIGEPKPNTDTSKFKQVCKRIWYKFGKKECTYIEV